MRYPASEKLEIISHEQIDEMIAIIRKSLDECSAALRAV